MLFRSPLLTHYSTCFQFSVANQYDGGDHVIMVGKVLDFIDHGHRPLIFHRGGYEAL